MQTIMPFMYCYQQCMIINFNDTIPRTHQFFEYDDFSLDHSPTATLIIYHHTLCSATHGKAAINKLLTFTFLVANIPCGRTKKSS